MAPKLTVAQAQKRIDFVLRGLGWSPSAKFQLPDECRVSTNSLENHFFCVGEMDDLFYVQVNPLVLLHPLLIGIGVYATRYRLCSGWHGVYLYSSKHDLHSEVAQVSGWLSKERFSTLTARRQYRLDHPECIGWSWKRILENGGPHYGQETCLKRRIGRK
jgi:hypothetical protein